MTRKDVYLVFAEANESKKPAEVLKANESTGLKQMCQLLFDDNIKLNVPDTPPPFVEVREDFQGETYEKKSKGMGIFVGQSRLSQTVRENRFLGVLESVHPKNAELLVAVCVKTNDAPEFKDLQVKSLYPKVTKAQAKKAFPELFKGKK